MNFKRFVQETAGVLTGVFPLVFCFFCCFGFDGIVGIAAACIAMIFYSKIQNKKAMPVYLSFLIAGFTLKNNAQTAIYSFITCSILLFLSSFCYDKIKKFICEPVVGAVMLAGALTSTVLFTNDYFGIGAGGKTVSEMIKSYLSLGFHPNWRGVLYGTIVMVIMITFPRKFKKLSKTISASFVALAVTLVLNIFLNPADLGTSINEISIGGETFKPFFSSIAFGQIDFNTALHSVLCGATLFAVCFYSICTNENFSKKDFFASCAENAVFGSLFSVPFPFAKKRKKDFAPSFAAAVILVLMFAFAKNLFSRIPLHSCAVVIIVGAWQSVDWKKLKKVFEKKLSVLFFASSVLSCLIFGIVGGILVSAAISVFGSFYFQNKLKDS